MLFIGYTRLKSYFDRIYIHIAVARIYAAAPQRKYHDRTYFHINDIIA